MDIKDLLPHDLHFFFSGVSVGMLLTLSRALKARLGKGI